MRSIGVLACLAVCVLGFWRCSGTASQADPPEPEVKPPPPPEQQGGCTIHWLANVNDASVEGVAALPDGRFVAAVMRWTGDRETANSIEFFRPDGTRDGSVMGPDEIITWIDVQTDSAGQIWILAREEFDYVWYRLDGDTLVRGRVFTRREYVDASHIRVPTEAPRWFITTDYRAEERFSTLQHHAEDGSVDWHIEIECPPDVQKCQHGRGFRVVDDQVFVLLYTWSDISGIVSYPDGFQLLVAQKDVGWVAQHDLTDGPVRPSGFDVTEDGALWLLGSLSDSTMAIWGPLNPDGTFQTSHQLPGPDECMHNGMQRRSAFGAGHLLQGSTCDRYSSRRMWLAAVDANETPVWQRHLALMNSTRGDVAWNAQRQFIIGGGTQNCCADAPAAIPFVLITDADAACLDGFAPALPPDPWDN